MGRITFMKLETLFLMTFNESLKVLIVPLVDLVENASILGVPSLLGKNGQEAPIEVVKRCDAFL